MATTANGYGAGTVSLGIFAVWIGAWRFITYFWRSKWPYYLRRLQIRVSGEKVLIFISASLGVSGKGRRILKCYLFLKRSTGEWEPISRTSQL